MPRTSRKAARRKAFPSRPRRRGLGRPCTKRRVAEKRSGRRNRRHDDRSPRPAHGQGRLIGRILAVFGMAGTGFAEARSERNGRINVFKRPWGIWWPRFVRRRCLRGNPTSASGLFPDPTRGLKPRVHGAVGVPLVFFCRAGCHRPIQKPNPRRSCRPMMERRCCGRSWVVRTGWCRRIRRGPGLNRECWLIAEREETGHIREAARSLSHEDRHPF